MSDNCNSDVTEALAAATGYARSLRGLSRQSRWLLLYLAERHPIGISTTVPLPCDYRDKPAMTNMRGLIKRGWAYEATMDGTPWSHKIGIFYLTDEGRKAAAELKSPTKTRPTSEALRVAKEALAKISEHTSGYAYRMALDSLEQIAALESEGQHE